MTIRKSNDNGGVRENKGARWFGGLESYRAVFDQKQPAMRMSAQKESPAIPPSNAINVPVVIVMSSKPSRHMERAMKTLSTPTYPAHRLGRVSRSSARSSWLGAYICPHPALNPAQANIEMTGV